MARRSWSSLNANRRPFGFLLRRWIRLVDSKPVPFRVLAVSLISDPRGMTIFCATTWPPFFSPSRRIVAYSAMLCFRLFLSVHKDVIRDGVPCIMNPDKEQQQRRSSNGKQRLAQAGAGDECR